MTAIRTSIAEDMEIVHLLKTTEMTADAIGKRYGLSATAVTRRGNKYGIDMKQRACDIRSSNNFRKARHSHLTHLPDTMTGDGLSLEWLSKEWKS